MLQQFLLIIFCAKKNTTERKRRKEGERKEKGREERKKKRTSKIEWEHQLYADRESFQDCKETYELGMRVLREHYDRNIEYLNGIGIAVERRDITDLFD